MPQIPWESLINTLPCLPPAYLHYAIGSVVIMFCLPSFSVQQCAVTVPRFDRCSACTHLTGVHHLARANRISDRCQLKDASFARVPSGRSFQIIPRWFIKQSAYEQ